MKYSVKLLDESVYLNDFDCGDDDLNDYLKNDALKNQKSWLSVTRLMYSGEQLIGFYTVVPDTLHRGRIELSDKIADYPYQKYPAIKLARFAVDKKYQHQGFGKELMGDFFETARDAVWIEGGRFITVDAKSGAVGFYSSYGFHPVASASRDDIVPMYLDFFKFYTQE